MVNLVVVILFVVCFTIPAMALEEFERDVISAHVLVIKRKMDRNIKTWKRGNK